MNESEITVIMNEVRKNEICVFPEWQQFDCTDENVLFSNCSNCWKQYCEKLKRKEEIKMNVKAGDLVIYTDGRGIRSIEVVETITGNGRIRVKGNLYNKYGSQCTANAICRSRISEATEELLKQVKEEIYVRKVIYTLSFNLTLTYDQAVAINNILTGVKTE